MTRLPYVLLQALGTHHDLFHPAVDVHRTPHGWVLKVELAGVAPSEIDIVVEGNAVTLSGQRRDRHRPPDSSLHRLEITYNHFERRIELPIQGSALKAPADFAIEAHDGMLLITLEELP